MQKITDSCLAVVIAVFLISAAVCITLAFKPLYYFDIDYLNIAEESGYSEQEIRSNYDALIDYNLSPSVETLEFPTFPMSEEARFHFREVKAIFQIFLKLFYVSAVFAAAGLFLKLRKKQYGSLKMAGIFTPAVLVAAGVFILSDWERAFVTFHELVFQNDYWLFDAVTDPVITILPDTFFLHCALLILSLILAGCVLCLLACGWLKRRLSVH